MIRQNPQTGERSLDPLKWGLIPYWCVDPRWPEADQCEERNGRAVTDVPGRRPSGPWILLLTVSTNGWLRRAAMSLMPSPMKRNARHFGIAGIWENWRSQPRRMGPYFCVDHPFQ